MPSEPQSQPHWPACEIPTTPPARGFETSATAELRPRYEDITQDGRVQLTAICPGLGAVWRNLYRGEQLDSFRAEGILPILRRMVIRGEPGPFTVHRPIQVSGTWRLAREANGDRIFLAMWVDAHAPTGSTLGPPPPRDSPLHLVGRIYAEHVLSRPFGPPAERRVTRIDAPGIPAIPEDTQPFEDAADLAANHTLESAGEHVFGFMHTDSNQHVNSLVYPRVFEEAVVRRLLSTNNEAHKTLLARAVEMRWRKPFFTGERAALALHVAPDATVAVGTFSPAGSGSAKPSCAIAMWLS